VSRVRSGGMAKAWLLTGAPSATALPCWGPLLNRKMRVGCF